MGRKHDAKYRFFRDIDNSIKAYWLGVLWGDGNNYRSKDNYYQIKLEIHKRDRQWLETFKQDLSATYPIEQSSNATAIRLRILSKQMSDDLIGQGLVPNKNKTQNTPHLSNEFIKDFIRGIFDADGNIIHKGPYYEITNNKTMCNFVLKKTQNTLGLGGGIYCQRDRTYIWILGGKNQVKTFGEWIYDNAQRKLSRKYEKYQKGKRKELY